MKARAGSCVVLGLTGGPGTGKSLAAEYMKKKGAAVLSGDDAGKTAVNDNPAILKKLVRVFGKSILTSDGSLDRRKLGSIVFADPDALLTLNRIVHPRLLRILKSRVNRLRDERRRKLIVVDAALIFEWGIADWCDYILVVTARRKNKLKRLAHQGLTLKQARDRIRSQIPESDKIKLADHVIRNDGTRSQLKSNVADFMKILSARKD